MKETLTLSIFDEKDWQSYTVFAESEFYDIYEIFKQHEVRHNVGRNMVDRETKAIVRIAVSTDGRPFAVRSDNVFKKISDHECRLNSLPYTQFRNRNT